MKTLSGNTFIKVCKQYRDTFSTKKQQRVCISLILEVYIKSK